MKVLFLGDIMLSGDQNGKIACCQDNPKSLGTLHFATKTNGGIYRLDENMIAAQIKELKKEHTYVAVVVHWGIEHKWLPEINDTFLDL